MEITYTTANVLDDIKRRPDCHYHTIFSDPPYQLSTVWDIDRNTGRYVVRGRASDFMNKWAGLDHNFLEVYFQEAFRVLKYGGYALHYCVARQSAPLIYYAKLAGFETECQPLHWYFISNFPKGTDAGKAIDKRGGKSVTWFGEWLKAWRAENNITQKEIAALFPSKTGSLTGCVANWEIGYNCPTPSQFSTICEHFNLPFESFEAAEREVIGNYKKLDSYVDGGGFSSGSGEYSGTEIDLTAPATPLAQTFDGWKYGKASLKQTNERVLIMKKPLPKLLEFSILVLELIENISTLCTTITTPENGQALGKYVITAESTIIAHRLINTIQDSVLKSAVLQLMQLASNAEKDFTKNQAGTHIIALQNAIINLWKDLRGQNILAGKEEDFKGKTDTFFAAILKNPSSLPLNTGLFWLNILGGICSNPRLFITETESNLITELKTLKSQINTITQNYTESPNLSLNHLFEKLATIAENAFIKDALTWPKQPEVFAAGNIGEHGNKPESVSLLVFRKPTKGGSVLDDLMACMDDPEISPAVLNIEGGRVPTEERTKPDTNKKQSLSFLNGLVERKGGSGSGSTSPSGRYPSDLFLDAGTAEMIDKQSGELTSGKMHNGHKRTKTSGEYQAPSGAYGKFKNTYLMDTPGDSGGASRINHVIGYEYEEHEQYIYCPKVSDAERNAGLGGFEEKIGGAIGNDGKTLSHGHDPKPTKNPHPTLKPIALNIKIATLFKLPDACEQIAYIPFCGTGSEGIGAYKAGITRLDLVDIDPENIALAQARFVYWKDRSPDHKPTKGKDPGDLPGQMELF